ncbi:MAG: hypothetical protein DLM57_08825 [Pseudonocardiales bacterium]|nr:MAG: hypothetical protein DLM57_08825 [Pseudonocardiales bacterium]
MDVDPATYEAASTAFGVGVATGVQRAALGLDGGLAGCAAMAGWDPAGATWSRAYDEAAATTTGVTQDVINGCFQLAALLRQTGFNYGRAESSSTPGGTKRVSDPANYATSSVQLSAPPSAAGSVDSWGPAGWWLIEHSVGYVWPNGSQGRLRDAAAAWTQAATGIGDARVYIADALKCIAAQVSPEVDDAMTACLAMDQHLGDLAAAYRSLAGACSDFAGYLDKEHSEVEHELASLLEWSAGIQVGGAVLSYFTAGISEAAAQQAEQGRILATATRVAIIIGRLIDAAGTVGEMLASASARVVQVSRNLKTLLGARLSVATAEEVGQLPEITKTAEQVSVGRMNVVAATRGPTFVRIGGPREFDPYVLKGMTIDDLRASMPSSWSRETSKSGGGEIYIDPANKGRQIRIMPWIPIRNSRRSAYPRPLRGYLAERWNYENPALRQPNAVMSADLVEWLVQEVEDLLDVSAVGLYEFVWLQRGRDANAGEGEMRRHAAQALGRLLQDNRVHLVWLRWPSAEPVEGPAIGNPGPSDWDDVGSGPYLALKRD